MNNFLNNNDLKEKTILLINTGPAKKKFIIQRLKSLGLKIIAVNKEKNWAEPYVDHWIITDTFNHADTINNIRAFVMANPSIKIDGALTFWEDDVLLASKIIDKFNLIGIPYNVAKGIRNKFLFRKFCEEHHLPVPQYKLIKNKEDLKLICQTFAFPLVIKPVFGSSSAYVVKIENQEELYNTYDYIKKNISTAIESSLTEGLDIMIEEYIDGDEVDIDLLLQNGKIKFYSITDNYKTNEPFFIETGFSIPSSLPQKDQNDLLEMAADTLEQLRVQNGCVHFEAKSTKKGPVPIEINLRMGGDEVYSFMKGAWNVDMIENAAKIATGIFIKINKPETPKKYFTGQDFLSESSGILVKLDINDEIKKKKYLEELHFYKEIGDPILVPPEGYEYLGWITVSGDNLLDAEDNLDEALQDINYKVIKFDTGSSFGKTLRKNRFSSAVLNKNLLIKAAKIEKVRRAMIENQKNLHLGIVGSSCDEDDPVELKMAANLWQSIETTLKERGYKTSFFDFNNPLEAMDQLKKSSVDLVFNAYSKINNANLHEPLVAAILEVMQIPYTGSNYFTLNLCADKIKMKKLLAYHNIPTPQWDYAYTLDDEINENLKYPLIVRSGLSKNFFGATNDSVVLNKEQLNNQLKKVIVDQGLPALVEEYVEGDEYSVCVLGSDENNLQVLPLARMVFNGLPENYWHINSYEAKWSNLPVYQNIITEVPAKGINKKLESVITEIALEAYTILDCHDYGLVKVRVDKDNNPYILKVTPNPSLNTDNCLPIVAKLIGLNYDDLLADIINMAIKRYSDKPSIYSMSY